MKLGELKPAVVAVDFVSAIYAIIGTAKTNITVIKFFFIILSLCSLY